MRLPSFLVSVSLIIGPLHGSNFLLHLFASTLQQPFCWSQLWEITMTCLLTTYPTYWTYSTYWTEFSMALDNILVTGRQTELGWGTSSHCHFCTHIFVHIQILLWGKLTTSLEFPPLLTSLPESMILYFPFMLDMSFSFSAPGIWMGWGWILLTLASLRKCTCHLRSQRCRFDSGDLSLAALRPVLTGCWGCKWQF